MLDMEVQWDSVEGYKERHNIVAELGGISLELTTESHGIH